MAIEQYQIYEDSNPQVINKKVQLQVEYVQELTFRYLRPPTPPTPGEILITMEANYATGKTLFGFYFLKKFPSPIQNRSSATAHHSSSRRPSRNSEPPHNPRESPTSTLPDQPETNHNLRQANTTTAPKGSH